MAQENTDAEACSAEFSLITKLKPFALLSEAFRKRLICQQDADQ
jgi:hypothetical protein